MLLLLAAIATRGYPDLERMVDISDMFEDILT